MQPSGTLSIVATPIGNLEDITLRALRTLKEADEILCEDTRVTKKLLTHYDIHGKVTRCDAEKEIACAEQVSAWLQEGKRVAYVSDAGTPAISDPGARLVRHVRMHVPLATIEAIPGPSSITSALSIAGLDTREFTFLGFVPHKKGRETFFKQLADYPHPVLFFESTHRIIKTLTSLREQYGSSRVILARELTKKFEEIMEGTPDELLVLLSEKKERQKGEFVVMVTRD